VKLGWNSWHAEWVFASQGTSLVYQFRYVLTVQCVIHSNELACLKYPSLEFIIRNLRSILTMAHFRFIFHEDVMAWKINAFRHATVNYILRPSLYRNMLDRQGPELGNPSAVSPVLQPEKVGTTALKDHVMAEAVRRRPVCHRRGPGSVRDQFMCFCGGQSGSGTDFLRALLFILRISFHQCSILIHSSIIDAV
jgi:hypothetical protein